MTMRLRFDGGTLLLTGSATVGNRADWEWDPRVSAWRRDALHYPRVVETLAGAGIAVEDLVPAWESVRWGDGSLPYLRKNQSLAVAESLADLPADVIRYKTVISLDEVVRRLADIAGSAEKTS